MNLTLRVTVLRRSRIRRITGSCSAEAKMKKCQPVGCGFEMLKKYPRPRFSPGSE